MKRKLFVSDIHGHYQEFEALLKLIQFDFDDTLIVLGDLVDAGPDARRVVEKVKNLYEEQRAVCILGNHDKLFLDWVRTGEPENYLTGQGRHTVASYVPNSHNHAPEFLRTWIEQHFQAHIRFLESLPFYYEDEDFIGVHAGIDPTCPDWKMTSEQNFLMIRRPFHTSTLKIGKPVIFGHTPTTNLHGSPDIWFTQDKIGIDGGVSHGYRLNCLEWSEHGYREYHIPVRG